MNWKLLIAGLSARGLKQSEIADQCGCRQSSISDLATGTTKQPNFAIGQALIRLDKLSARKLDRIKSEAKLA